MKRIFRRNQIIITTLAVMIAAAGYLNYSSKKEVAGAEVYEAGMMDISDSDILAENQAKNGVDDGKLKEIASLDGDGEELLPDGNEVAAMPESAESAGAEVSGQETAAAGIENPGEAVLTGGTGISEYIAGVQLGREQIRAKNKETLMQIINSDQISEEEKQTAIQNLIGMTEISEKENAAETLLKAKGFVDPVVSITDGKVDVVVNAASLSDQERAQIEDIVKRKAPADYREKLEEVIGREAITASLQENGLTEKIFTAGEKDVTKILAGRRKQMALEIKEFYKTL